MKSHSRINKGDKEQAEVIINFTKRKNPANNFAMLIRDLKDYARRDNISIIKVIDYAIEDLNNLDSKDYERNLEYIIFDGDISEPLKKGIIDYLIKVKNIYEKKDSQDKKDKEKQGIQNRWGEIEKEMDKAILDGKSEVDVIVEKELDISQDGSLSSKEKKSILKKLAERKKEIEAREVAKAKANQAIEEIKEIVDREFAEGNIETRAMYLKSIESEVRDTNKIDGEARQYLLEMISGRIKEEIYYEQVEEFTNGFQFLSEYPELVNATSGFRKRKFTDRESYDRFCDLRTKLQSGLNEYSQVNRLLENEGINDTDKRILEARKSVMDKEIERRREIEVR